MGKRVNKNTCMLLVKCWVIFYLIFQHCFVLSQNIEDSQLTQFVKSFKQELESHIDRVLAYKQIQQMLDMAEAKLAHGPINGEEIFKEVFQNVSLRYNDVVLAANTLKRELEKNISLLNFGSNMGPPVSNGGPLLAKCCCGMGPGLFDGRLRDRVQQKECYGSQDALLESLSKTGFISILKANYETLPGITWQYFADSDGHYVQFPASNRVCDKNAPPLSGSCQKMDSPLTKEWFVEKLHMEQKNLVVLMDNSIKQDPSVPQISQGVIARAVERVLATLTPKDKVNVVAFPSRTSETVEVPAGCANSLFVASQANLNKLKAFAGLLTPGKGEPNLLGGLKRVYDLLEAEKNENPESFKTRTNLVLVLLNGKSDPFSTQKTPLFEMIAKHQLKLENRTQHFIYTLGKPDEETLAQLAQVADQNNLNLEKSTGIKVLPWPQIPNLVTNQSVGPEGALTIVENQTDFESVVGRYFQRLPPQVDKELTTIAPVLDTKYGLGLTVAVPVYNGNQTFGVVAVDGSMATVFSEVVNFDVGTNSYVYVVDSTHGHVLLHPKLRDPSETRYSDTIFPRLKLLEPDLTNEQRSKVLSVGSENILTFEAKLNDIHPDLDGELVTGRTGSLSPATVYSQQIKGTSLIVVLVVFKSDVEEPKFHSLNQVSLHGIYHRLDKSIGAPGFPGRESICRLENGHFLSFKQSVIKFSPGVFQHPEVYKYSDETLNTVELLNRFVTYGVDPKVLNPGLRDLIFHTLNATDGLDALWTSNSRQVIERFYGSVNGVFRIYPGTPLMNTFDHRQTDWYKRSVAFPNTTMYHYGKLSVVNRRDVIIISRAVTSTLGMKRFQGVAGMTITPRFLTSQLINTWREDGFPLKCCFYWQQRVDIWVVVKTCSENDYQCHIVDTMGNILDSLNTKEDRHLSKLYPWISAELVTNGKLKQEWCTGFSDGFHKVTFTLTEDMTLTSKNPCQQFWLHKVKDTNIFVLVLGNREKLKCDDSNYKSCSSCQGGTYNPRYQLSIPQCDMCHVNVTPPTCQCQCYCDTDLDLCHGQFKTNLLNFPTAPCFYAPIYSTEFKPGSPGPMHNLERCPIPCVAIEDLDICNGLEHCKLSSDTYQTCIWKDEDELKKVNVSRFFPTTTPPRPPMPSSSDGASKSPGTPPHGPVSRPATPLAPGTPPHGPVSRPATPLAPGSPPLLTSQYTPGSVPHSLSSNPHTPAAASSTKSTSTVRVPPNFVSTANSSPIAPVMTGSPLHPVSGSAAVTGSSHASLTGSSLAAVTGSTPPVSFQHTIEPNGKSSADKDRGLSGGAIAALVIGLLALGAIAVFVGVKMYHKKFRRAGDDESSKYRAGSTMFDSTVFLRSLDQVSINASAPSSTNVPYQEMAE